MAKFTVHYQKEICKSSIPDKYQHYTTKRRYVSQVYQIDTNITLPNRDVSQVYQIDINIRLPKELVSTQIEIHRCQYSNMYGRYVCVSVPACVHGYVDSCVCVCACVRACV